jgi:hypothetical protein
MNHVLVPTYRFTEEVHGAVCVLPADAIEEDVFVCTTKFVPSGTLYGVPVNVLTEKRFASTSEGSD